MCIRDASSFHGYQMPRFDGIPLGKVFHTNFLVLSETDVKLGGPPGEEQHCPRLQIL